MAKIWGFAPYSGAKNAKNGGFLRVCGRKTVGGAIKNAKNPPGWGIFVRNEICDKNTVSRGIGPVPARLKKRPLGVFYCIAHGSVNSYVPGLSV